MAEKEIVIREINELPGNLLQEVLDFVRFLKSKSNQELS